METFFSPEFSCYMIYLKSHELVRYLWTEEETGDVFKYCKRLKKTITAPLDRKHQRSEAVYQDSRAEMRATGFQARNNGKLSNRGIQRRKETRASGDGVMAASAGVATETNPPKFTVVHLGMAKRDNVS